MNPTSVPGVTQQLNKAGYYQRLYDFANDVASGRQVDPYDKTLQYFSTTYGPSTGISYQQMQGDLQGAYGKAPGSNYSGAYREVGTGPQGDVYGEKQYYTDQIGDLQRILGNIGTQRDQGLARLDQSFNTANTRLGEDKQRAMLGYDQQSQQNEKQKLRGTEQVDSFAANSFNNLQRVLQGANAGKSSLSRLLVPTLVSKAAGQRRQGVFDTYGENQQGIDMARADATTQFTRSEEDLTNQRNQKKEDFLRSIIESEQDLYNKIASAESARAAASGLGYEGARAAGAGSREQALMRESQLNALFSQFQPTLAAQAVNLKTPELGQYTVDQAAIRQGGGNLPAENQYYLPLLRRRQQQQA